jgi:hypothetical protein
VLKSGTTYNAILTPLVAQDCNESGVFGFSSFDELKQKLLNIINNDPDLNTNCPNTKNYISNYNFSPPSDGGAGGGPPPIKFNYKMVVAYYQKLV